MLTPVHYFFRLQESFFLEFNLLSFLAGPLAINFMFRTVKYKF